MSRFGFASLGLLVALLAGASRASAQELKLDETIPGWIPVSGDVRFSFPVPADDVYTFRAADGSGGQGSVDTVIQVVASDGLALGGNDDSGIGLDSELILRLAAGETVELVVREYGDGGGPITVTVVQGGTAPPNSPGDPLPELPEGTCDIDGNEVRLAELRDRAVLIVVAAPEEELDDRVESCLADLTSACGERLAVVLLVDPGDEQKAIGDLLARARDAAWAWRTVVLEAGAFGACEEAGLHLESLTDRLDLFLWEPSGDQAGTGIAILADRDGTIRAVSTLSDPLVARALALAGEEEEHGDEDGPPAPEGD